MKPLCGRADLVRAIAGDDGRLLAATARILGFVPVAQPRSNTNEGDEAILIQGDDPNIETVQPPSGFAEPRPLMAVPFWRLEAAEMVVDADAEERLKTPQVSAPVEWKNRPTQPPRCHLLAPWRELQPRLRQAATEHQDGLAIDMDAVVRCLSEGRLPTPLPRRRQRRWGPLLQIIFDRGDRLTPFWADQDAVAHRLSGLLPPHNIQQAIVLEGMCEPRLLTQGWRRRYRRPPPGSLVLVLGDLGCYTPGDVQTRKLWLELGRSLIEGGCRPLALMPCPLDRCSPELGRYWSRTPWERPPGAAVLDPRRLRQRAERLLRLLSPAVRIEPGLLREARLLLPGDEADVGAEGDAWNHPAVVQKNAQAATLDPDLARQWRMAFPKEPPWLQGQVLALLRCWRGEQPQEIWFEEIRSLASASRALLPEPGEAALADAFFIHLSQQARGVVTGNPPAGALSWYRRFERRCTESAFEGVVGEALHKLSWTLHRDDPGYSPGPGFDPAWAATTRERQLMVGQSGRCLVFAEQSDPMLWPETLGSLLGTLRSGNGLVHVETLQDADLDGFCNSGEPPPRTEDWGDGGPGGKPVTLRVQDSGRETRCPMPGSRGLLIRSDREQLRLQSRTKPQWADAMGRDPYGLWARIALDASPGKPVSQRLRWIPPGRFMMGSPDNEPGRWQDEGPQRLVSIRRGYWLFDTPCAQALWEAVMDENPSRFKSPDRPVENVDWNQVQRFIARLNSRVPGLDLVLPSEAQWEYACRAGTRTAIYTGDLEIKGERDAPALDPIAWYGGNSGITVELVGGDAASGLKKAHSPFKGAGTHPLGKKQPNPWGLYDMLGNVWEWCRDGMGEYTPKAETDPVGPMETGGNRVIRGGSWFGRTRGARAACRLQRPPDYRGDDVGFRCARPDDGN